MYFNNPPSTCPVTAGRRGIAEKTPSAISGVKNLIHSLARFRVGCGGEVRMWCKKTTEFRAPKSCQFPLRARVLCVQGCDDVDRLWESGGRERKVLVHVCASEGAKPSLKTRE